MKPSTRVSLVGLGALALLSSVHWAREQPIDGPPLLHHLLGVLPNFAAAIAIPYILFGIWQETSPASSPATYRKRFVWLTLFAGVGLILWELGQRSSRGLFFDPEDIVATLVGLGVGWSVFAVVRDKTG